MADNFSKFGVEAFFNATQVPKGVKQMDDAFTKGVTSIGRIDKAMNGLAKTSKLTNVIGNGFNLFTRTFESAMRGSVKSVDLLASSIGSLGKVSKSSTKNIFDAFGGNRLIGNFKNIGKDISYAADSLEIFTKKHIALSKLSANRNIKNVLTSLEAFSSTKIASARQTMGILTNKMPSMPQLPSIDNISGGITNATAGIYNTATAAVNGLINAQRNLTQQNASLVASEQAVLVATEAVTVARKALLEAQVFTGQNATNLSKAILKKDPLDIETQTNNLNAAKSVEALRAAQLKGKKATLEMAEAERQMLLQTHGASNAFQILATSISKSIKAFVPFLIGLKILNAIQQAISETIETVKGLSQAFADLRKVVTKENIDFIKLTENIFNVASAFGKSSVEVAQNISIFAQQGNTISRSLQLATISLVASSAASFELKEATEFLTAVTKIYKDESEDLVGVIDKIINVQAKHAATAKDLANSIKATGVAASNAGVSMDEFLGITTAIISVTRKSGNAVGNSLKTIFAKMGGAEAQNALKAIAGIDSIKVEDGVIKLKTFGEVIRELSLKWGEMGSHQKRALSQAIGGLRRYNDFMAMMDNYDEVVSATTDSMFSNATAIKAAAEQAETFEARMQQVKNSVQLAAIETGKLFLLPQLFDISTKAVVLTTSAISNLISLFRTNFEESELVRGLVKLAGVGVLLMSLPKIAAVGAAGLGLLTTKSGLLASAIGALIYKYGEYTSSISSVVGDTETLADKLNKLKDTYSATNKVFDETQNILDKNRTLIDSNAKSEKEFRDAIQQRASALGLTVSKNEKLIDQEERLNKIRKLSQEVYEQQSDDLLRQKFIAKDSISRLRIATPGINRTLTSSLESGTRARRDYIPSKDKSFFKQKISEFMMLGKGQTSEDFATPLSNYLKLIGDTAKAEYSALKDLKSEGINTAYNDFKISTQKAAEVMAKVSEDMNLGRPLTTSVSDVINAFLETSNKLEDFIGVIDKFANGVAKQGRQAINEISHIYATQPQTFERQNTSRVYDRLTGFNSRSSLGGLLARQKMLSTKSTFTETDVQIGMLEETFEKLTKIFQQQENRISEASVNIETALDKMFGEKGLSVATAVQNEEWRKNNPEITTPEQFTSYILNKLREQIASGETGKQVFLQDPFGYNPKLYQDLVNEVTKLVAIEKELENFRKRGLGYLDSTAKKYSDATLQKEQDLFNTRELINKEEQLSNIRLSDISNQIKYAEAFNKDRKTIFALRMKEIEAIAAGEKAVGTDEIRQLKQRIASLKASGATQEFITNEEASLGLKIKENNIAIDRRKKLKQDELKAAYKQTSQEIERARILDNVRLIHEQTGSEVSAELDYKAKIIELTKFGVSKETMLLDLEEKRLEINKRLEISLLNQKREKEGMSVDDYNAQLREIQSKNASDKYGLGIRRASVGQEEFLSGRRSFMDTQASALNSLFTGIPQSLRERKDQIEELNKEIMVKNQELVSALAQNDVQAIATIQHELLLLSGEMDVLKDKTDIWRDSLFKVGETIQSEILDRYSKNLVNQLPIFGNVASRISNFNNGTNFDYSQIVEGVTDGIKNSLAPVVQEGSATTAYAGAQTADKIDEMISSSKSGIDKTKQGFSGMQDLQKRNISALGSIANILGAMGGQAIGGGGRGAGIGSAIGSTLNFGGKLGALGGVVGGILGGLVGGLFDKKKRAAPLPPAPVFNEIQKVEIANSATNPIPIRDVTEIRPEERISLTTSVSVSLLDASQLSNSNIRKIAQAVSEENNKLIAKIGAGRIR